MKELLEIQKELKAPKGQKNTFGNYNYRSCEDILEAVKPLLSSKGCGLILSDEVVNVGDKNYVKASARFICGTESIYATAYAREALQQKGMSDPQITGSASSYARKYALNGLFAIDDTKDDDATYQHNKAPQQKPIVTNHTIKEIEDLALIKDVPLNKITVAYKKDLVAFTQKELNTAFKTLQGK